MNVLDLFSGIGGFSLGLERAGMRTVAFCEIEPFCRAVLKKHWPHVPCYDDVTLLTGERLRADGIAVDAICGGFPCQDLSESNVGGAGLDGGQSGLWAEYRRLIGELRPRFVIVENVANLLGRGLDRVLGDLAALGFDAEWHCLPASAVGAPHERDRVWIIAYPVAIERRPHRSKGRGVAGQYSIFQGPEGPGRFAKQVAPAWCEPWPTFVDRLSKVDDGLSCPVDEFNAYANAVLPQIPEIIGRAILAHETNRTND